MPKFDTGTSRKAQRKARRRAQSRAEIIEVAREILAQEGVAGLTLELVARELEMTKPALYYYFRNKQALLFELVVTLLEEQTQTIAATVAKTSTAADAVAAFIQSFYDYYNARMPTFRMIHLQTQIVGASNFDINPEQITRLQPLNDLLYGYAQERIEAEQAAGLIDPAIPPRQTVFLAHMATIGFLTYRGLSESAGDSLRYTDEELIAQLISVHTGPLRHA